MIRGWVCTIVRYESNPLIINQQMTTMTPEHNACAVIWQLVAVVGVLAWNDGGNLTLMIGTNVIIMQRFLE